MPLLSIHQTIHGYRDGHRLLSSSVTLPPDSAWAMLVLSDMSGPAMQPGFDEYITGYPLPGTDYFVFAKTWYAGEMSRPGCVWTHSLLIPREQVDQVSTAAILFSLTRPKQDAFEMVAKAPILIQNEPPIEPSQVDLGNRPVAEALVGAVFGQVRPVIVAVENARELEPLFLRIWDELWPSAKSRFSFCTGALIPRSVSGVLMDLQAVPRAVPSSHFRKSASAALIVDLRTPATPDAWVETVIEMAARGDKSFRSWMEVVAGQESSRDLVPRLIPIFEKWHSNEWTARSIFSTFVSTPDLDSTTRTRLVRMLFERTKCQEGTNRLREFLHDLCVYRDADLSTIIPLAEEQTDRLFDESQQQGCDLILSLVAAELTELGERVLRVALLRLKSDDLEAAGKALSDYFPTIVRVKPTLAVSPFLWREVGSRASEVLSQLAGTNLPETDRLLVIDAILTSGCDVTANALLRFGGKSAFIRALEALSTKKMPFSLQWQSALSEEPNLVIDWLEDHRPLSLRELDLGTRLLNPKVDQNRLVKIWTQGTSNANKFSPRVAAFGLSLSLAEGRVDSSLLALCFQPTYDALSTSKIESDEWDWLMQYAPSLNWRKDWDKCERIAAALARLASKQSASVETIFAIARSPYAIGKIVSVLNEEKTLRQYLRSLRRSAMDFTDSGTREQRDALLND